MRLSLPVAVFACGMASLGQWAGAANTVQAAAPATPSICPSTLGPKAQNALAGYNEAVKVGDAAKTSAARNGAVAAAKTDAERCVLAQVDLSAAAKANDYSAMATHAQALAANPTANKALVAPILLEAGKLRFNAKDYAGANPLLEGAARLMPSNGEATIFLAESKAKSGGAAEAPVLARKAIGLETAAGRKAPETWYKHAVQFSIDAKDPAVVNLARDWVMAYPSPDSWSTATQLLIQSNRFGQDELIDIYRLQRAAGALGSGANVGNYANLTAKLGLPGETVAALKAGVASGVASNAEVAPMLKLAEGKAATDKASLASGTTQAVSSANAKTALAFGDANYGYGNYAKAADVYRAVLGMKGADASTANLRLGMALAMAGDKGGAQAALKKVDGSRAAIAQYWLAYLETKA